MSRPPSGPVIETTGGRSPLWPWLRRGGLLIIAVVVLEYLVLPQLIGASDDISLLSSADPLLLVVAFVLEVCSLASYTALTRTTLPAVGMPSFWVLLRIDLTGYGFSHVLPGGGATAAALRYRLLTKAGVDGDDAFAGATVQTGASIVALIGVFMAGTALSLQAGVQASYAVAGGVALVLLVALSTLALLLTRFGDQTSRLLHRLVSRLSAGRAATFEDAVSGLAHWSSVLLHDKRLLARTLAWPATNWLLDAACLWCCLMAYGYSAPVGPLLALYGALNLLAMLPITPGGLGVVEGVMIPAIVAFGAGAPVALLGVLTWRLLQYWIPIPVAILAYGSLRLGVLRHVHDTPIT